MKSEHTPPPDDLWESDAVWALLDQAPPHPASSRFVDNTVRAARLIETKKPWWHRLFAPAPLAGFATATAAIAFAVVSLVGPTPESRITLTTIHTPQEAMIEDIAETEMLIAAVDHLENFSDRELACLIGF